MKMMRRNDLAMTKDEAWRFLQEQQVGRLGLVCSGDPYIVPMNYEVIDNRIYLHAALTGRKMDCLQESKRICFEVDELVSVRSSAVACKFGCYYKSVIVYGVARVLDSVQEKVEILTKLTAKYAKDNFEKIAPEQTKGVAVIEISVLSISGKQNLPIN